MAKQNCLISFQNWANYAVIQRRSTSGCIPTCYEMLLRAAGATGIDFQSFQDDFDLDKDLEKNGGSPRNHFDSVAQMVGKRYPNVMFGWQTFKKENGLEKAKKIGELLSEGKLPLLSLALSPQGAWHIMPVIEINESYLLLFHHAEVNGVIVLVRLDLQEMIRRHGSWPGGVEIAYLEKF